MSPTVLAVFFGLSNLLVSIAYTLMAFAPKRTITQRYMRSLWWLLPLLALYLSLATLILLDQPDLMGNWDALYLKGGILGSFATALSDIYGRFPQVALLHGWVHIVIGDLFMARWAYFDASERGLPAWMIGAAVLLIGFVGPIGVAIYLILRETNKRTIPEAT